MRMIMIIPNMNAALPAIITVTVTVAIMGMTITTTITEGWMPRPMIQA